MHRKRTHCHQREAHSLRLRERHRRQRDRIALEEVIGDPYGGGATVLAGGYLFLKPRGCIAL
jgi:hypothetical protein